MDALIELKNKTARDPLIAFVYSEDAEDLYIEFRAPDPNDLFGTAEDKRIERQFEILLDPGKRITNLFIGNAIRKKQHGYVISSMERLTEAFSKKPPLKKLKYAHLYPYPEFEKLLKFEAQHISIVFDKIKPSTKHKTCAGIAALRSKHLRSLYLSCPIQNAGTLANSIVDICPRFELHPISRGEGNRGNAAHIKAFSQWMVRSLRSRFDTLEHLTLDFSGLWFENTGSALLSGIEDSDCRKRPREDNQINEVCIVPPPTRYRERDTLEAFVCFAQKLSIYAKKISLGGEPNSETLLLTALVPNVTSPRPNALPPRAPHKLDGLVAEIERLRNVYLFWSQFHDDLVRQNAPKREFDCIDLAVSRRKSLDIGVDDTNDFKRGVSLVFLFIDLIKDIGWKLMQYVFIQEHSEHKLRPQLEKGLEACLLSMHIPENLVRDNISELLGSRNSFSSDFVVIKNEAERAMQAPLLYERRNTNLPMFGGHAFRGYLVDSVAYFLANKPAGYEDFIHFVPTTNQGMQGT